MSRSDITNVASLESLDIAMKDYGMQSLAVVRDFASMLNDKISNVNNYKGYLERRVQNAQEELGYCRYIQSIVPPEYRPSCRYEAGWLETTRADLERYRNLLSQLNMAYDNFMNKYNSYSNYIDGQFQSSINALQSDIAEINKYLNNQMQ